MRDFLCQSCDKPKATLRSVSSSLINGIKLTMCQTCIDSKFEPRSIIILSVHQFGITDIVRRFISEHRYVGDVIEAVEVV